MSRICQCFAASPADCHCPQATYEPPRWRTQEEAFEAGREEGRSNAAKAVNAIADLPNKWRVRVLAAIFAEVDADQGAP